MIDQTVDGINFKMQVYAVDPRRNNRYQSVGEFMERWNQALMKY